MAKAPNVHSKAALTGKGQVFQTPASGATGPSNHAPQTGSNTSTGKGAGPGSGGSGSGHGHGSGD